MRRHQTATSETTKLISLNNERSIIDAFSFSINRNILHNRTKLVSTKKKISHSNMESNSVIEKQLENRVFKCFVCSECFDSFEILTSHVREHIEKNNFKNCNLCNKTFNSVLNRALHNQIHDTFFQCKKCKRGYTDKTDYESHVENHKNDITYKCPVCQEEFEISDLANHVPTHVTENSKNLKNVAQPSSTINKNNVKNLTFNKNLPGEDLLGKGLKFTFDTHVDVKMEIDQDNDCVIISTDET